MDVPIVDFDAKAASREDWRRYHAYRRLRHEETDPGDPLPSDGTVEAWMRHDHPHWEYRRLAVLEPGRPDVQVGEVYLEFSRPGTPSHAMNEDFLWASVELLRPHRRRGIGRAMLAAVAETSESRGRSAIQSWAEEDDGKAVIGAIGAKVVQNRYENRLAVDRVDWPMVEAWAAEGPSRSPSTALRWFRNAVPEDAVEEYARAFTEVFNGQPFGAESSFQGIVTTPESFRDRAKLNADVGGTWLGAYTQEPDGEISGLTEAFHVPDQPTFLGQGMTGVRGKQRGRGLGKWVKAAMLLRVRAEFPEVRVVRTGNATENAAMLSINNRLGFRPHKRPVIAEIRVDALRAYLARAGTAKP